MAIIPITLNLSTQQQEELTNIGVDIAQLYLIRGAEVKAGIAIDCYASQHWIIFFDGEEAEHRATFKHLFNTASDPEIAMDARGVWVYKTPSAKFVEPENLATLNFSTQQQEELEAIPEYLNNPAMDITKIYLAKAADIKPGLTVDAYCCGHWVLFLLGTEPEHVATYKCLYGTAEKPERAAYVREMWVYETPTAKFISDKNLVTVNTTTPTP
jgi:hypothetical protein